MKKTFVLVLSVLLVSGILFAAGAKDTAASASDFHVGIVTGTVRESRTT